MYKKYIKSLLDFFISIIALIILFPILALASLLILFFLGRPILFIQTRAGINNSKFNIIKFRTMKIKDNDTISDRDRKTHLGDFLRKYSIDELPELINVIKGEMSIVGPRPLYFEYNKLYNVEQSRRLSVKPGITGLAQVKGRNNIEWNKKFEFDLHYTDNLSFSLDMKIIILTFFQVVFKKNINYSEDITMPLFKGNDKLD